jgi:hypothetical protein
MSRHVVVPKEEEDVMVVILVEMTLSMVADKGSMHQETQDQCFSYVFQE